jgi:phage I-like protein
MMLIMTLSSPGYENGDVARIFTSAITPRPNLLGMSEILSG